MALQIGSRLGLYEIVDQIGAGGMGEVYRARDTKLGREVALKVLPELFATDPERLARFNQEARVLAALNHPHIAQVYGTLDATPGLIMELVNGEDLAQRISAGAIPVTEALQIARQVADALDAAHSQGIVHRDLKPANVKLREDGTVKVLDFGLAKALDWAGSGAASPIHSATITSPAMTRMGVILGTAAYMAPEQAKGKAVDRGADVWALGVLLYEMLTGRRAFEGETITDVLAAIVTRDPDWSAVPADTPPAIVRLLRRCLERDRRRRLVDASEVRFQIEEALSGPAVATAPGAVATSKLNRPTLLLTLLAAAMVLGALMLIGFRHWWQPAPSVGRYSIELPGRATPSLTNRPAVAISPDGTTVVFLATEDGIDRLYARRLDAYEAIPVAGTEGASHPVISPDGRWVAFTTQAKLAKVPLAGGPVVPLTDVSDARGLSWDTADSILFTPAALGAVFRIPAAGGTAVAVTSPRPEVDRTHRWPQALPDSGAIIYTVGSFMSPDNYDDATIEALITATGERRRLLTGAAMARYVPTGHLVFVRGTTLFGVAFDAGRLAVIGTPVPLLEGVSGDTTTGAAHFSVSNTGTLTYLTLGADTGSLVPTWMKPAAPPDVLPLRPGAYSDARISPDGRSVALSLVGGGGRDIWVHHFDRKTFTRITFGGQHTTPLWSADGATLYYVTLDAGGVQTALHKRQSDGSSDPEVLVTFQDRVYLEDLMPNGRAAVITRVARGSSVADLETVELVKGATPTTLLATRFDEFSGRVSPDGRWMAYASSESGRPEIYVRPISGSGGRWQISTGGGEEPNWSADGRRLFYRSGNFLMAVSVSGTGAFQTSGPAPLLSNVYNLRNDSGITYAVDPKGDRFLMIAPPQRAIENLALRVVLNWTRELTERTR